MEDAVPAQSTQPTEPPDQSPAPPSLASPPRGASAENGSPAGPPADPAAQDTQGGSRHKFLSTIGALRRKILDQPARKASEASVQSQPLPEPLPPSPSAPRASPLQGHYSLASFLGQGPAQALMLRRKSDSAVVVGFGGRGKRGAKGVAGGGQWAWLQPFTAQLQRIEADTARHLASLARRRATVAAEAHQLLQRHCDHRPCNLRQINVALLLVDRAFARAAHFTASLYRFIHKQHGHVLALGQATPPGLVQHGEHEALWAAVQANSDACVGRANDEIRAVYKTLFGLVHVLEKQQKAILYSSEYTEKPHGAGEGGEGAALEEPYVMKNVPVTVPEGQPKIVYTHYYLDVGAQP